MWITVKSGGECKKVSTISGKARYCRNTLRHCELLHFRGYRKAKGCHAKVWQSTAYRKPRIAPNRLVFRAVKQLHNSLIIGRSPRIFMQHHQAMLRLKMKILGMTWCVYEGICDLHKFPRKHFSPSGRWRVGQDECVVWAHALSLRGTPSTLEVELARRS